jgi:hypothetical protein
MPDAAEGVDDEGVREALEDYGELFETLAAGRRPL